MLRQWATAVPQLMELCVICVTHLLYGLYIFSSAVAADVFEALNSYFHSTDFQFQTSVVKSSTKLQNLPPFVLVHGTFGFGKGKLGSLSYFGGAEKKDKRVLVPDLGALTSVYDRACELFYYLKGGQVDYGKEHSEAYGHSQFGRVYEQGHYPEWDEEHPVHFVAHSAGAQVVRLLQQMLADKAFKGYENTSENWVLSITSLSGVYNGATRTYLDGMKPEDVKAMRLMCPLQLCRIGAPVYDWLDISWLKTYYSFGFDHFNMSRKKMGLLGLLGCLKGNRGPFSTGDWILPDLTIQESMRLNSGLKTFPNTYYFSYAAKPTRKTFGRTASSSCSIFWIHPLLFIRALQMSRWRFPSEATPPYKGYRDEDWQDNDGAVNLISMTHPRFPIDHPSRFVQNEFECELWEPGIWYYKIVEADHTSFVINRKRAGVQFDLIYDEIFERCRKLAFKGHYPSKQLH